MPTPVRFDQLTEPQRAGTACVWCSELLGPLSRRHVGAAGPHRLFACPACSAVKRLPVWPEYGSA